MNNIGAFVKLIIVISFLWCAGESLMPDDGMKKYSGYIYGLIVISLIASLFINAAKFDYSVIFEYNNEFQNNSTYIREMYEQRLEDILREKFDDKTIFVTLTDEYRIKEITCDDQNTYNEIMGYLND